MHSKMVLVGGMIAAAFIAAACSTTSSATGPYGAPNPAPSAAPSAAPVVAPSPSPVPPAASGTVINVGSTRLGRVLVDANGLTVYLFLADSSIASNCNSASCVQYWPPVLTKVAPRAGAGVTASLLGSVTRANGTRQVTYAGHPLY